MVRHLHSLKKLFFILISGWALLSPLHLGYADSSNIAPDIGLTLGLRGDTISLETPYNASGTPSLLRLKSNELQYLTLSAHTRFWLNNLWFLQLNAGYGRGVNTPKLDISEELGNFVQKEGSSNNYLAFGEIMAGFPFWLSDLFNPRQGHALEKIRLIPQASISYTSKSLGTFNNNEFEWGSHYIYLNPSLGLEAQFYLLDNLSLNLGAAFEWRFYNFKNVFQSQGTTLVTLNRLQLDKLYARGPVYKASLVYQPKHAAMQNWLFALNWKYFLITNTHKESIRVDPAGGADVLEDQISNLKLKDKGWSVALEATYQIW